MRSTLILGLFLLLVPSVRAQDGNEVGEQVYVKYCGHCHGDEGDGKGVAAPYLKPAPRDFTSGKYKIRTTPTGLLPTDENLKMVLKRGLPYTSMPAFPNLSEAELGAVIEYIKAFSSDFEDQEYVQESQAAVFPVPSPPPYTPESVEKGREVYGQTGCARCHGDLGRGDGNSAPTLVDDWGVHIRVADLTMPWTFRGGGTRQDIFRTMSSGFNGTPMPGFHGTLPEEDIWSITNYMVSLSGGPANNGTVEAPYTEMLRAVGTNESLDLENAEALFANAPESMFPIVGQIVEPGRNFYPSIIAVRGQAVYNEDEIAIKLSWNDMRAEIVGHNAPDLDVPLWEEEHVGLNGSSGGTEEEGDIWGDAAAADDGGGFWGEEEVADEGSAEEDGGSFWGEEEVANEGDGEDIWGDAVADEGGGGDDFWGEEDGGSVESTLASGPDTEFSDAIAIQFPQKRPEGVVKPYIFFGDGQNPVELWFADLAQNAAATYIARGSRAIAPGENEAPEMVASFDKGEWSVIFKRKRKGRSSISFPEDSFTPIAFTVWDGFNRERGNKRGLTAWYDLYLEPLERPSPFGPMARAGFGVLGLELLLIVLVRRKYGKGKK